MRDEKEERSKQHIIIHTVLYSTSVYEPSLNQGFREKNRDLMRQDIIDVLRTSHMDLVRALIGLPPYAVHRWHMAFLKVTTTFAFKSVTQYHHLLIIFFTCTKNLFKFVFKSVTQYHNFEYFYTHITQKILYSSRSLNMTSLRIFFTFGILEEFLLGGSKFFLNHEIDRKGK